MNTFTDSNSAKEGETCWSAPSNIALIKYWGKKPIQIPCNPSLSMTLENSRTKTLLQWKKREGDISKLSFSFEGEENEAFKSKVETFLNARELELPFLRDYDLEIQSQNTFPHSAGIASSASSMAALALCLCSMEERVLNLDQSKETFLRKASNLSRLGSGSACRSLFPDFAVWGQTKDLTDARDEFAVQADDIHSDFLDMRDAILIVDPAEKSVSSSQGHKLMESHPYSETRFSQARRNLSDLLNIMRKGDWEGFGEILEREALELHSLMGTSSPSFILMKPETLAIIEKIRNYRNVTKTQVYFTLDAGPNVHLIYPSSEAMKVEPFIENELINLLADGRWIADRIGKGPRVE